MADIAYCQQFMCDMGINTQAEVRSWLLKNHPDKGGEVDPGLFEKVAKCYSNRIWCEPPENISPGVSSSTRSSSTRSSTGVSSRLSSSSRSTSASSSSASSPRTKGMSKAALLKKRKKIFNCMRQTENWSKMLSQHKFDSKKFDPTTVEVAMHNASPKLEQLFQIIEQVDANDLATHGKYFKHFIFSDVKEEGYGAKILASAFISKGYKNLISTRAIPGQKALKMALLQTDANSLNKSFGLLSSSAIFGTDFTQKFKKEVLQTYNKRPDNIQGANMRFIILDSGFKEGIDLFDVKYVHIFEPSMTIADLKQTIGRATRTCGQKGLNFEPNVGWPLYVYNYYIAVPEEFKDMYQASDPALLENPEGDKYIFKNTTKFKDAALLYSEFDRTMTRLAEQLYKFAPVFSVDFSLTANIHRIHDVTYLYDVTQQGLGQIEDTLRGGARRAFKDIDEIKCKGKCGLRSTNDIPATVDFLLKVYLKYKHDRTRLPAKHIRGYLCAYMKQNPNYCKQVNAEWANRAAMVPNLVHKKMKTTAKTTAKTSKKKEREDYLSIADEEEEPELGHFDKSSYLDEEGDYLKVGEDEGVMSPEEDDYLNVGEDEPESEYLEILPRSSARSSARSSRQSSAQSSARSSARSSAPKKVTRKSLKPLKLSKKTLKILNRTKTPAKPKSSSIKSSPKSTPKAKSASSLKIANEVMQQLDLVPYIEPIEEIDYAIVEYTGHTDPKLKLKEPGAPLKKLNFTQMRDFIKTNYAANFTWDEIVVENKCVDPAAAKAPTVKVGGASRIMKLNPTQDFVRTFFTPQSPYKGLLLFHSVGTGKCHALDTPILMYDGTIKMVQNIVVGDKLMGDDSKPRSVLSLARGQDTLYDIIPVKGEKYTVNSEHILCLKYSGTGSITNLQNRQKNLPFKACHIDNKTVTLKAKSFATREEAEQYLSLFKEEDRIVEIEVRDYLNLSKSLQRELKGYRKGVEFSYKPVDFDPYIIGLWLGDGSKRDPVITSQDAKILKYLMNELPKYGLKLVYQSQYDYRISCDDTTKSNALIEALRKYNLINNKHVPYDYKCTNRENRLLILAGLIDTDRSYSNTDKCYEITQKSNVLADDILFLARSLGFAAYRKKSNKSWTYKGVKNTNEYNRILISGSGLEEIPVKLTRKMADTRCQIKDALITGISVEKATDCGDYYGFTLDGNCRYLLGDFTVTHNTCSAIATATSSFEREGYTILWVTRNTLKIDVYKNMFDDVCHIILAERMQRDGLKIPDDPAQRKRLLSKNWIEPISYKTFSNLLTPGAHNVYMDKLIERNGKADILRKTLIIIDEAHKLYGGDLKASERPNMEIMERLVQKSYQVSGKDSAKLLIMTATPFTNSPIELFKLINLCKDDPAERITTDIKEFKRKYMNSDNVLTEAGSKKLADKLSGYISYLNREQDPTQFAQPIMIEVPTIMSQIPDEESRKEFVDKIMSNTKEDKNAKATERSNYKILLRENKERIQFLKTNVQETKKRIKATFKAHSARCKTVKNKAEKAHCMAEAKREMEDELETAMNGIREELERLKREIGAKPSNDRGKLKALKERVEAIKSSLVQEAMLIDRCKSLKL